MNRPVTYSEKPLSSISMRSDPPTEGSSRILTARAGRGHIHSVMPTGSSHSSKTTFRRSGQHPPHHRDPRRGHGCRFRRSSLAVSASARSDQNVTCSAIHSSAGRNPAERTVSQ